MKMGIYIELSRCYAEIKKTLVLIVFENLITQLQYTNRVKRGAFITQYHMLSPGYVVYYSSFTNLSFFQIPLVIILLFFV